MTLKTEMPVSIEHRIHRVYHQYHHHHHYHLHQPLDHDHLHIHNQSIHRSHIASQNHLPQLQQRGETSAPLTIQAAQTATVSEFRSINQLGEQQQLHESHSSHTQNRQHQQQQLYRPIQEASTDHQLMQASGLTHLIARHNQREQRILSASHGRQNRSTAISKQRSQIQFFLLSAFAYIVSPIDLIPEALFGIFGILDDLIFLFMCLFCVAIILLYPLFREVRRTMFDKLGFKQKEEITNNKLD